LGAVNRVIDHPDLEDVGLTRLAYMTDEAVEDRDAFLEKRPRTGVSSRAIARRRVALRIFLSRRRGRRNLDDGMNSPMEGAS
jgi:hypothetical protein